jgi:hypothetical protein
MCFDDIFAQAAVNWKWKFILYIFIRAKVGRNYQIFDRRENTE